MTRIYTLQQLRDLANQKRAVVCPSFVGFVDPKPAAFALNLIGTMLCQMIESGLYVYEPKNTARKREEEKDNE